MSLDREKLQQTLNELHAQLDSAESLDPELAARLRAVSAEIDQKLEQQPPAAVAPPREEEATSPGEALEDAAVVFEETHPVLAGTVRRLVDMLAQMGI